MFKIAPLHQGIIGAFNSRKELLDATLKELKNYQKIFSANIDKDYQSDDDFAHLPHQLEWMLTYCEVLVPNVEYCFFANTYYRRNLKHYISSVQSIKDAMDEAKPTIEHIFQRLAALYQSLMQ